MKAEQQAGDPGDRAGPRPQGRTRSPLDGLVPEAGPGRGLGRRSPGRARGEPLSSAAVPRGRDGPAGAPTRPRACGRHPGEHAEDGRKVGIGSQSQRSRLPICTAWSREEGELSRRAFLPNPRWQGEALAVDPFSPRVSCLTLCPELGLAAGRSWAPKIWPEIKVGCALSLTRYTCTEIWVILHLHQRSYQLCQLWLSLGVALALGKVGSVSAFWGPLLCPWVCLYCQECSLSVPAET